MFERVEFSNEDVGLVNLIGNDDQFLLRSELENISDLFFAERCTSWVTRVDHSNGTSIYAFFVCFCESSLNALETCAPACRLIKVVWDAVGVEDGEGGSV